MSLQPLIPGTLTTSAKTAGTLTTSPKTAGTFGRYPGRNLFPDAALYPSSGSALVPTHATTF